MSDKVAINYPDLSADIAKTFADIRAAADDGKLTAAEIFVLIGDLVNIGRDCAA